MEVVRRIGNGPADGSQGWQTEPGFWLQGHHGITLPEWGRSPTTADYLAYSVARHPGDLLAHARRILLCLQLCNAEGVYGALLDLFIALGPSGRQLRERMLRLAKAVLSPVFYDTLHHRLDTGVSATEAVPPCATSVLSRGLTSSEPLVQSTALVREQTSGALEQARDLIDSGHVAEAQALLEKTLQSNPEDDEVGLELLDVYRHTRDTRALNTMCGLLSKVDSPAAHAWVSMAELFALE